MKQGLSEDSKIQIQRVASEALSTIERIATAAKNKRDETRQSGSDALAAINTLNSIKAANNYDRIAQSNKESYQALLKEPAIARVLVANQAVKN